MTNAQNSAATAPGVSPLDGPSVPPASGGPPQQLVVLLHGLGANGDDLISLAPFFAEQLPDALFVAPNAPTPNDMAPFGLQWFSMRDTSPAAMLAGIRGVTPSLHAFLETACRSLNLPTEAAALVGFSQGAMLSLYAGYRWEHPIAGILGYSGALLGGETLEAEATFEVPAMLIHGADDPVIPAQALDLSVQALQQAGLPVESDLRPGLGHSIDEEGAARGRAFLASVLGV